jgi:hypothetical protein
LTEEVAFVFQTAKPRKSFPVFSNMLSFPISPQYSDFFNEGEKSQHLESTKCPFGKS